MSENIEVNEENTEISNEKKTSIIDVNERYQIKVDSMQYKVQKLHTVDPTKFPTFDANKQSAELRQEWRDDGYFGLHMNGLVSALKYIIVQEVGLNIGESTSLKNYLKALRYMSEEITGFVNDQIKVEIKI